MAPEFNQPERHTPTPADIARAALRGERDFTDPAVIDAVRMLVAAAEQNAVLHRLVRERDDEIAQLTDTRELDTLTMTYNRDGLARRFNEMLQIVDMGNRVTDPQAMILILIDGDHFKHVNDSYGHAVGDSLLWNIGYRLWLSVRSEDTVARVGGDEFAILLPVTRHTGDTIYEDALEVLADITLRLDAALSDHNNFQPDAGLHISLSKGAFIYKRGDEFKAEEIFAGADHAMYMAKQNHRGGLEVWQPYMGTEQIDPHPD
jgi:diguanylate cyclase